MSEHNRPGYVFHCEHEGCVTTRGLELRPLLVRGVRRYRWLCGAHR